MSTSLKNQLRQFTTNYEAELRNLAILRPEFNQLQREFKLEQQEFLVRRQEFDVKMRERNAKLKQVIAKGQRLAKVRRLRDMSAQAIRINEARIRSWINRLARKTDMNNKIRARTQLQIGALQKATNGTGRNINNVVRNRKNAK
jgi:hypothetical protein